MTLPQVGTVKNTSATAPSRLVSLWWVFLSSAGKQVVQLAGFVALSRLLSPEQLGAAAIVTTIAIFANIFVESGVLPAVVHRRDLTDSFVSAALYLNALSGLVLFLMLAAFSLPLSNFFNLTHGAMWIIISGSTVFLSLSVVPIALKTRSQDFKGITVREVSANVLGQAVAVFAAYSGYGVVAAVLIAPVTALALTLLFWRPILKCLTIAPKRADFKAVWSFSRHLIVADITTFFTRNADSLILGKFASLAEVGLYSRAYSLMMLPVQQVTGVIGRVLLPRLAGANKADRNDEWFSAIWLSWQLGLPLAGFMIVAAPQLVPLLLGDDWSASVLLLQILAISVAPQLLSRTSGAVYQGIGRPDRQALSSIICMIFLLVGVFIGVSRGATGVAIGTTIALYACTVYLLLDLHILTRFNWRELGKILFPASIACIAAVSAGLTVSTVSWGAIMKLQGLLAVMVFSFVYSVCSVSFDRRTRQTVGAFLRIAQRRFLRVKPASGRETSR